MSGSGADAYNCALSHRAWDGPNTDPSDWDIGSACHMGSWQNCETENPNDFCTRNSYCSTWPKISSLRYPQADLPYSGREQFCRAYGEEPHPPGRDHEDDGKRFWDGTPPSPAPNLEDAVWFPSKPPLRNDGPFVGYQNGAVDYLFPYWTAEGHIGGINPCECRFENI